MTARFGQRFALGAWFCLSALAGCGPADAGGASELRGGTLLTAPSETAVAEGVACTAASQLVYVLSNRGEIYSFDPPTKVFTKVATLDCPIGAMSPNSMAVDRQGHAWVNYFSSDDDGDVVDGSIFQVDIATGRCQAIPIALPGGWYQVGMGFSSAVTDPTDTLYVAANHAAGACSGVEGSGPGLGVIDLNTGTLSAIGPFSGALAGQNAELTGTGDGRLFGFFELSVAEIAPIDKATAATSAPVSIPGVQCPSAFAFSFWGGDFYLFTAHPFFHSSVAHFTSADGTLDTNYVADAGFTIVGAGASTCAPTIPPPR
jgi:hypothetical protein